MIKVALKSRSRLDAGLEMRLVNLFSTIRGSVPYMRTFGISANALDMPMDVAVNVMAGECARACHEWEPSVRVRSVTAKYTDCAAGRASFIVEVEENG